MRLTTVFVVLTIALVMLESTDGTSRRRSSSTSRRRSSSGSRRRSNSGSRRRSSSGSRRRSSSSNEPAITKDTPIKPTSFQSPVIVRQTQLGSRSSTFKTVVASNLSTYYAHSSAPVYRQGYPMYRAYISIPEDRAVRLSYEQEELRDAEGDGCVFWPEYQTLALGIDDALVGSATDVTYSNGTTLTSKGIDNTVSLGDINEQKFKVISLTRYNTSIVDGTSCTQVWNHIEGTMVTMYETNPDRAGHLKIDNKLLPTVIALFVFMNAYFY